MAAWIAKIHKLGFVWHDPKLDNILFDEDTDRFLVCDFDSCRPIGYVVPKGETIGTPGYTLSIGISDPYQDILKFAQTLAIYSGHRNNWLNA